jgi:hypothetical protein
MKRAQSKQLQHEDFYQMGYNKGADDFVRNVADISGAHSLTGDAANSFAEGYFAAQDAALMERVNMREAGVIIIDLDKGGYQES